MLKWEHYPPDTWSLTHGEHIALIKQAAEDDFVYVIGTVDAASFNGTTTTLVDAQAKARRYMWAVNNMTPEGRKLLIYLL